MSCALKEIVTLGAKLVKDHNYLARWLNHSNEQQIDGYVKSVVRGGG